VATSLRLNPHPSKAEVMRHTEIQRRSFELRERVRHPPAELRRFFEVGAIASRPN